MISRRTNYQLIAFAVVALLALAYSAVAIAQVNPLHRPFAVRMELPQSGGLYVGSDVSYRGVHVGKVTALGLDDQGVVATLQLDKGTRVSSDTRAVVTFLSAIGQQYVDLRPPSSRGPFLHGGSTIAASNVDLPPTAAGVLADVDRLLTSIDPHELDTLMTNVAAAFDGLGPTLQQALSSTTRIATALQLAAPATRSLITNGSTVLDTQVAAGPDLASFSRSLHQLATTLQHADPDLRRVISSGDVASLQLVALLSDPTQRDVATLLGNLVTTTELLQARQPALRQLVVSLPAGLEALAAAVPGDTLLMTVTQDFTPICQYATTPRTPHDVAPRPAKFDASCHDDVANEQQRGAQNVPRPEGDSATPAATTTPTAAPTWMSLLLAGLS